MTLDIAALHPRPTSLTDAKTCGEDHAYNLALATTYAAKFCGACATYHATIPVNRVTGASAWSGISRPALIRFVSDFLATRNGENIDILIAGAGDTSTFATCAHAAAAKGQSTLDATRFHILDKCETPLALNRDFAHRHKLSALIETDDLITPARHYSADIIVLHSVLNFIPREHHREILRNMLSWLKAKGRLFIWNSMYRPNDPREKADRKVDISRIKQMVEDGRLVIGEDRQTFFARLEARVEKGVDPADKHPPTSYFEEILAELGAPVVSFDVFDDVRTLFDGSELRRPFLQAVVEKS